VTKKSLVTLLNVGAFKVILFLQLRYVHYSSWRSLWTEKKVELITPLFFISKETPCGYHAFSFAFSDWTPSKPAQGFAPRPH